MLAAYTELFPERNAWYPHEIALLIGDDTPLLPCGMDVYAVVIADRHGIDEAISAPGNTIDEALEALYHLCVALQATGPPRTCQLGKTQFIRMSSLRAAFLSNRDNFHLNTQSSRKET